jgi:CheY-like chemotaxis protein
MINETILYLSDQAANGNSILAVLKATGNKVVSTNSGPQAIALLYVLRTVAGVVLNRRVREQNTSEVARSLQGIRPDVPIAVQCGEQINHSPSYVDACVDTRQPLERLTAAVRRLVTARGLREFSPQF